MNLLPITCSLFPAHCSLLAIDSATSILSVAVSRGDETYYKEADSNTKQSESAMLIIDELMKEADLKPNELNGVICMQGPGSFTGLRIGYSIAKGLALSLNIPFITVPAIQEIIKDGGDYFYKEKRGYARELLAAGRNIRFNESNLYAGPKYNVPTN